MNKLDASHQCVLKHWETITKMNACRNQVDPCLKEFALKVCSALHSKHKSDFERQEFTLKEGWFYLNPTYFQKWKNSDEALLSLGVERISAENLLQVDNANPCLAYVYSPYRAGTKNDTSTNQLISIASPPSGFESTFDVPYRGYVFTKELPALTPEDICNPAKLEHYFTDPLVTLIEWYNANKSTIEGAFIVSHGEIPSI